MRLYHVSTLNKSKDVLNLKISPKQDSQRVQHLTPYTFLFSKTIAFQCAQKACCVIDMISANDFARVDCRRSPRFGFENCFGDWIDDNDFFMLRFKSILKKGNEMKQFNPSCIKSMNDFPVPATVQKHRGPLSNTADQFTFIRMFTAKNGKRRTSRHTKNRPIARLDLRKSEAFFIADFFQFPQ